MWSLGCVYLEILVWYIDGYQALLDFRASREGQVQRHGLEDEGFYHETSPGKSELRKPVVDMINALSHRCEGVLKDIVDTIPSLLQIDPKDRPSASQLVSQLSHLGTGASTSTGSYSATASNFYANVPLRTGSPSRLYRQEFDSETDSDFGGMVKITRPSDG